MGEKQKSGKQKAEIRSAGLQPAFPHFRFPNFCFLLCLFCFGFAPFPPCHTHHTMQRLADKPKSSRGKCGFFPISPSPSSLATCAASYPHSGQSNRPGRPAAHEKWNRGFPRAAKPRPKQLRTEGNEEKTTARKILSEMRGFFL